MMASNSKSRAKLVRLGKYYVRRGVLSQPMFKVSLGPESRKGTKIITLEELVNAYIAENASAGSSSKTKTSVRVKEEEEEASDSDAETVVMSEPEQPSADQMHDGDGEASNQCQGSSQTGTAQTGGTRQSQSQSTEIQRGDLEIERIVLRSSGVVVQRRQGLLMRPKCLVIPRRPSNELGEGSSSTSSRGFPCPNPPTPILPRTVKRRRQEVDSDSDED